MKIKRFIGGMLSFLLLSVSILATDYSDEAFKKAFDALDDDSEIIKLCRDFMTNAEDINVIRTAQSSWEATDPSNVIAFSKTMADQNPASAKYTYLYGRVAESIIDKIKLGRKAISLDKEWPYGYRLVTASYMQDLFNGNDDADLEKKLSHMLADDGAFFSKLVELDGGAEYAMNFLLQYQLYTNDFTSALETLEKGKKEGASFAGSDAFSIAYAGLGRYDDAMAVISTEADAQIARGLPADRREEFIDQYYINALSQAKAHDEVLNYIMSKDGYKNDPQMLYTIACVYSLKGDNNSAFENLDKAINAGWDNVDHTNSDSDLRNLHTDSRWKTMIASVQEKWDAGADNRKAKALSGKILKDAPMWSLENAEGITINLADLNGKVVVLDFWATWCGPCRMAMPVINEFVREHAKEDVVVFSVNVWEKGKKKPAKFMKKNDYAMRLVYGNDELAASYGVRGIPHLCVIDKNGKIRYEESGYSPQLLENLIWWTEDLLSES